jgi:hypothetical protein
MRSLIKQFLTFIPGLVLFMGFAINSSYTVGLSTEKSPMVAKHYLSTEMATSVTQGWRDTRTDLGAQGLPISIVGQRYSIGLGTHAPGEMIFKLDRKHSSFNAYVGIDDAGAMRGQGSVVFCVLLDSKNAFESGVMKTGQPAKPPAPARLHRVA